MHTVNVHLLDGIDLELIDIPRGKVLACVSEPQEMKVSI
jgi:hypothetical protein